MPRSKISADGDTSISVYWDDDFNTQLVTDVNRAASAFAKKDPHFGLLPRNSLFTVGELLGEFKACGLQPPARRTLKSNGKPFTDEDYIVVLRAEISKHRKPRIEMLLPTLEQYASIKQLNERLCFDTGFWKFDKHANLPRPETRWKGDASSTKIFYEVTQHDRTRELDPSNHEDIALAVLTTLHVTYLSNIEAWLAQKQLKNGNGIWGFAQCVVQAAINRECANASRFVSLSNEGEVGDRASDAEQEELNRGLSRSHEVVDSRSSFNPGEVPDAQQLLDDPRLTPRQKNIVRLLANGKTYRELCKELGVKPSTYYQELKRIRKKLRPSDDD